MSTDFISEDFKNAWSEWVQYKKEQFKFSYRSKVSEQKAITELKHISGNSEEIAIQIINHSIAQGWKGLFALRENFEDINIRKNKFYSLVAVFINAYPKEVLRKFYDYWTEKTFDGLKMRFEKEKAFEVGKRLELWNNKEQKQETKSNEPNFNEILERNRAKLGLS